MIFRQLLHDQRSCASYLVGCPSMGVAAVIDPQGEPSTYSSVAERHGLRITDVIDTHIHADHLSSARRLAHSLNATLRLGKGADVGFDYEPLTDGDVLHVGNRRIEIIHTPGHTPEHICLLVDDWFVLTGDTLFVGDVGRVDLALAELDEGEVKARAERLHASLQRLLELPDDTEVYPGHYAGSTCGRGMDGKTISTIGRERRTSRALRLDLEGFTEFQLSNVPPLPDDFDRIKRANIGYADERSMR
ncbi:MAG: MBL fold metallo-hydrolase [Actinomycetota bacterium]